MDLDNCAAVTIRKETDPEEDPNTTNFPFTKTYDTDPVSPDTFTLQDDGIKSDDNVLFGTDYTVTEDLANIPAGWDLVSINCFVAGHPSSGVTPVINLMTGTVTFSIDNAADVLDCTYTNRARGTIIVEKITDDGTGSFEFTSSTLTPSPFTLTTTAAGRGRQGLGDLRRSRSRHL